MLCIEVDGKLAGVIGIHLQEDVWRKNAEMGYCLAEPFWGRGIMTQAIKLMTIYGFEQFDINRICSPIWL
ncbi:MAG: ribosomal-protein-alanine N-acetyltransferase [Bacteroidia bacterium]